MPALREILAGVARREIVVHSVETAGASPFASSLLFDYVAAYMYDGDTPLAERRAGALTLDRDLLRELLGQEELRELLDPDALADLELSLQALTEDRQATTLDGVHDLLRRLGDLSAAEVAARRSEGGAAAADPWLAELAASPARRQDADRRRRALDRDRGRGPLSRRRRDLATGRRPGGLPGSDGRARSTGCSLGWARTPWAVPDARAGPPLGAARDGVVERGAGAALSAGHAPASASSGRAARSANGAIRRCCGCFAADRWPACGARSNRSTRRRSRDSCPAWHGVAPVGASPPPFRGTAALERLAEVVDQLAGLPIPASVLERDVLPARIPGYQPRLLDELGALGRGGLGRAGEPRPRRRPDRPGPARAARCSGRSARRTGPSAPAEPRHDAIREHLARRGASFYRELFAAARRRLGPRGPRRAVGPGLGGRGDQRHVRAASGPALEADRQRRRRAQAGFGPAG